MPWINLAKMADTCKNGVDINDIIDVEEVYKELLQQQLENNSKLNGFLAERRKNLREIYGLKPTANVNIDEAKILEAFANVNSQKSEDLIMRSLSSFYPHTISTKLMIEEASIFNFWSQRELTEGNKLKFENCSEDERSILTQLGTLSGGYIQADRVPLKSQVVEGDSSQPDQK
jgi:hypothetical protein